MVVFSKFETVSCTCREYVHPWTKSCTAATTGLGLNAVKESFRIYLTVYMLAMLMKGRIPTVKDLFGMTLRIAQSTAFLTCHAASYSMFVCLLSKSFSWTLRDIINCDLDSSCVFKCQFQSSKLTALTLGVFWFPLKAGSNLRILRRTFGNFNVLTASFVPAFLASYVSILVERPSRRGLLSLYVTNVASETLFRMAAWRGLVRPIQYGDIAIFAISVAGLLHIYRNSEGNKDAIFGLLRFVVGPWEEKGAKIKDSFSDEDESRKTSRDKAGGKMFCIISQSLNLYMSVINKLKSLPKHASCMHPSSCLYYITQGALKLFSVGYGLQVCLRLLLQMKQIIRNPKLISRCLLHRNSLRFGAFLGGFSAIFRLLSCALRWTCDHNSKYHAAPAAFLAGLTFAFFPDITIALYFLWKWVEVMYSSGVEKGSFPKLPGATILLYCASTAVLFHAALLEPNNLRPSYWKFLHRISGGWIATMDRTTLDPFGLQSSTSLAKVLKETGTNYLLYPHCG